MEAKPHANKAWNMLRNYHDAIVMNSFLSMAIDFHKMLKMKMFIIRIKILWDETDGCSGVEKTNELQEVTSFIDIWRSC